MVNRRRAPEARPHQRIVQRLDIIVEADPVRRLAGEESIVGEADPDDADDRVDLVADEEEQRRQQEQPGVAGPAAAAALGWRKRPRCALVQDAAAPRAVLPNEGAGLGR